MLALLASQLLLVVSHDAAARGQLRPLERYADRVQLVIALGKGNGLSDSAVEAMNRWPALVAVELVPPLSERDAAAMRKLQHLAVRLPPIQATPAGAPSIPLREALHLDPTLARLGGALVRVDRAPSTTLGPGPCPGSDERVLPDGQSELRFEGEITSCELDALRARLELHPEAPGDLPPEMQPATPPGKQRQLH